MKNNILYRADGSKDIGMGHLSRAVLISDYFKSEYKLNTTLIIKDDSNAQDYLDGRNIDCVFISNELDRLSEANKIVELQKDYNSKLTILDVLEYDVDQDYTHIIRSKGVPLAVITDDSYKRIINSDVVINGNPCQKSEYYKDEKATYFIGPKYFIMNKAFSKRTYLKGNETSNILLTLGGSDHNNLIFKVLSALEKISIDKKITIVTSKATGYLDQLKEFISTLKLNVHLLADIQNLKNEFDNCSFSITAGGNTLFERIASQRPGATICQLQRQMEIADRFDDLNVNKNIGYGPDLSEEEIFEKLNDCLNNKKDHIKQEAEIGRILDGKGLSRVAEIFFDLLN